MLQRRARRNRVLLAVVAALVAPPGAASEGSGSTVGRPGGLCEILDLVLRLDCGAASGRTPSPGGQAQPSPSPAPPVVKPAEAESVRITPTMPRYDPRRLSVVFRTGVSRRRIDAVLAGAGLTLERAVPAIRAYLVGVNPARRAAALASLRASSAVQSADREALTDALDTIPNDSDWPQQWGLRVAGFPKAWDTTAGSSGVVVAVVDTGVDGAQPDLRGALVPGYDFVHGDPNAADDHGHGTAVAGIIAARADNHQGIAGICWRCSIMPVKVLDAQGTGDDTVVAAGIVWAADHGARVINLSLGSAGTDPALGDAVAYAVAKGAVVVAAARNDGAAVPFYPAADPAAIGVAATTAVDKAYPWSNFGSWVQLAAPGCNVAPTRDGGYGFFCGTSAATPLVSGLAALAFAAKPTASPEDVLQALERAAVPIPGLARYGRVDAPGTLAQLAPATTEPVRATVVFDGRLGPGARTRTYVRTVGAGRLSATLTFPGGRTLSLALLVEDRPQPLMRVVGRSPLHFERPLPGGPVALVVAAAGERRTPFVLSVSYVPTAGAAQSQ